MHPFSMSFRIVFARACPLYKMGDRFTLENRAARFADGKAACIVLVQDLARLFVTLVALSKEEQDRIDEQKFSCSGCSGLVKFQFCDEPVPPAGQIPVSASLGPSVPEGRDKRPFPRDTTLWASLEEIPLAEILQILHARRLTGILTLELGDDKGLILLREGSLIQARYQDAKGRDGFYRIMAAARRGSMSFVRGRLAPDLEKAPKIGNFMVLILDAMKQAGH